jgi:ribosomal protein S1
MGKTVTVSIPSWMDEEEFRRIVDEVVKRLEGRVPVEELRKRLGIRPEDLVEDLDVVDVEVLEARERERLSL